MADALLPAAPPRLNPTGIEKAAILLLTLGPEAAAAVAKHLSEVELLQISNAITRLRAIPRANAAAVHEEAWRWLSSRAGLLVDGEGFVRKLIEIAPPASKRQEMEMMRDLAARKPGAEDASLATRFRAVAPKTLAQMLATEHPQVIAFVLANLDARQAAEVLRQLPDDVQAEAVRRIADLQKSAPPELVVQLADVLAEQVKGLGGGSSAAGQPVGGTKVAAEIMNLLDETVGARVFGYLDEQAPEMAEAIRNQMFTFDDLIRLDNRGMQLVLKEVPREDLLLALKTASPGVKEKIFGNMSARAVEILQDDLSSMGPVRLKDVEKAQGNVIVIVRRLADEQKITLGGGGDAVV